MSSSGEIVPSYERPSLVWLVWCYDHTTDEEVTHVFSTRQRAKEFCDQDSGRHHVVSYRVVDDPAQTEGQAT